MIGMDFKAAKGMFFDRKAVRSSVDKAKRRNLSRFGAFVRRRAQTSIKPAPKSNPSAVSAPGKPPRSHNKLLRKFILFRYVPASDSVVIGPAKLNQKVGNAPEALEHGGKSTIGAYVSRGRVRRKKRVIRVRARPYMRPAFEAELPGLSKIWANSVR